MCVIIVRNPGIEIPFNKVESACIVNSDGFGLSVVDRGKIETIKHYDPKGNDPEIVAKLLEAAKEQKVYLHLRFATKGSKREENCHPFTVVEDDNYEMRFMHNGTLSDFGNNDITDSEDFSNKVIKPLVSRTRYETDNPLADPFVHLILQKYKSSGSRFVLYDNEGNDLILGSAGDSQWHDNNGWWSSNVYSFNRTHRTSDYGSYGHGWTNTRYRSGGSESCDVPFRQTHSESKDTVPAIPGSATTSGATSATRTDSSSVTGQTSAFPKREPIDPQPVATFLDLTGLQSMAELTDLTDDQIAELIDDRSIAVALVRDLLYELYVRDNYYDGDDD